MPLSRRLYLGASIYTKIFRRLPGTRHSLRFPQVLPFLAVGGNGLTIAVHAARRPDGRRRRRRRWATSKSDGKEFFTFCAGIKLVRIDVSNFRRRRDSARAAAVPPVRPSSVTLFSLPLRVLCLYPRWHERRLRSRDPEERARRKDEACSPPICDEFIAAGDRRIVPCASERIRRESERIEFRFQGVYISTSISEHSAREAL